MTIALANATVDTDPEVEQVRRFNRAVTQRVGALSDHYLARSRPLSACRVLWEIGVEGAEVRALRAQLGIDSGQLSRLLRALEADDLIQVIPSPADARIRVATLTPAGMAERRVLDGRSDELARSILAPLDPAQRERLVTAMRSVERLITASLVETRIVDPEHPDAKRCLRAYVAELNRRSDIPFDPRNGSTAEPHEVRGPAGAFLVAYLNAEAIGCGAVKHRRGGPSDIKRMWVAESARGLGIGRRLLRELEELARESGAGVVQLETNAALVEAITMYRSAGYAEVPAFNEEPFADHWFAKPLS
ncbi:MAG TPA: bifunctional helix-turn-helix transcriptional regulator/GNAT family N-acetyltransferase [Solirubrobacteraceae bacterium]|nr:bifunctional helix-turn-helix transcriptional regulator/GNAT family N-acetyltransferase [Solirubrobacteraceae bacterium]